MKARIISLIILWVGAIGLSHAQPYQLEARAHYGFIIPHRVGVKNLITDHVQAIELYGQKQTNGSKRWHHEWNLPQVGFTFFLADLGNADQLGWTAAFYPYVRFKTAQGNRWRLNYKLGSGLGYMSKTFDADDNYKNVLVGSHFNLVANMMLDLEFDLSDRLSTSAGIGFTHYSNGAFKIPNLGINIPTLTAGLRYNLSPTSSALENSFEPLDPLKYEINVFMTAGLKENYPVGQEKYGSYALTGEVARYLGRRSKVSLLADLFYNTSIEQRMQDDSIEINSVFTDVMQQGVMLSYQMQIDRLSILVGNGIYVHSKFKDDGLFYHRIGVTYRVFDRLLLRWMLKTHFFKADHFELGLGYNLYR